MSAMRRRIYLILERDENTLGIARWVDIALITLISLNVLAVISETVPSFYEAYGAYLNLFELISVVIFTAEYIVRIWVSNEEFRFSDGWRGRLRYACTPLALIDLIAILPTYVGVIFGVDLRILRAFRLLRVFKLTRYSAAMTMLLDVLQEEASTLFASFFILFILLILASTGAYLMEHQAQPEAFGSIPAAMWWALVTLTTVGYGDVTPITTMGRVFGGLVTVIGVGMAALPAGILASGLAEHIRARRDDMRRQFRAALEDGVIDADEEEELEKLRKRLGLSLAVQRQVRDEVAQEKHARDKCTCPRCGHEFTN